MLPSMAANVLRSMKINFNFAFLFSLQPGTVIIQNLHGFHLCGTVNVRTPSSLRFLGSRRCLNICFRSVIRCL